MAHPLVTTMINSMVKQTKKAHPELARLSADVNISIIGSDLVLRITTPEGVLPAQLFCSVVAFIGGGSAKDGLTKTKRPHTEDCAEGVASAHWGISEGFLLALGEL